MSRTRLWLGQRTTAGAGLLAVALLAVAALGGCDAHDMADQGKGESHEASAFFPDGMVSRPLVPGVVARGSGPGQPSADAKATASPGAGQAGGGFPFRLTEADVLRGQQRFEIYCAPCHGRTGDGNGMIVQRGFPKPPSLYLDRLRNAPPQYFYDVITNGYGAMYSYNDRVASDDRWRIAAYIRALQLSTDSRGEQASAGTR